MSGGTIGARGAWAWWPLRLLVLFVVLLALYIGSQIGAVLLVRYTHAPRDAVALCTTAVLIVVMIAAYRLLVRGMERRPATELGASKAVPLAIGGATIGFILFCLVMAALWFLGVARFQGMGTSERLAIAAVLALAAAVGEEIIFRGAVYRLFEEGFGTTVAIVLSGLLFGLIHAGNHGATLASSTAIALEAGVLLAAAYALTRSLWLPIGFHFGWNFTEGGIFGTAVSGGAVKGLFNVRLVGSEGLTGGDFGPEASVVTVVICLAAAAVILAAAATRGQWRPMRFRLRSPGAS
jgi:uncharacterized protein